MPVSGPIPVNGVREAPLSRRRRERIAFPALARDHTHRRCLRVRMAPSGKSGRLGELAGKTQSTHCRVGMTMSRGRSGPLEGSAGRWPLQEGLILATLDLAAGARVGDGTRHPGPLFGTDLGQGIPVTSRGSSGLVVLLRVFGADVRTRDAWTPDFWTPDFGGAAPPLGGDCSTRSGKFWGRRLLDLDLPRRLALACGSTVMLRGG